MLLQALLLCIVSELCSGQTVNCDIPDLWNSQVAEYIQAVRGK